MCGVYVVYMFIDPDDYGFYEYAVGSSLEKHHAKAHESFNLSKWIVESSVYLSRNNNMMMMKMMNRMIMMRMIIMIMKLEKLK